MKRLLIGVVAAVATALMLATPAGATPSYPCEPEPVCHEFDWAIPYIHALENRGMRDLVDREGTMLLLAVESTCKGEHSEQEWAYANLTTSERQRVMDAMPDICAEALG